MEKNNKFMMIIIIALLVAMMGTIVGVSLYVLNLMNNQAEEIEGSRVPQTIKKLAMEEITSIIIVEDDVTNLQPGADGRDNHFVRLSIQVGIDNTEKRDSEAVIAQINWNLERARMVVKTIVYAKSRDDLRHEDSFLLLADEIKLALQETFESNLIVEVIIFDFLVQ
jgi:flagellar basal body-associated protein FliL